MGRAGQKIDDAKRKLIMADYAETQSFKETARRFDVSDKSVQRIVAGMSR